MMWFTVVVLVVSIVVIVYKRRAKAHGEAEAVKLRQERIARIAAEISNAICAPGSAIYHLKTVKEIQALIATAADCVGSKQPISLTGETLQDEACRGKAQWYIDQTLKWRAEQFNAACARQTAFRKKIRSLRLEKAGQLSAAEITALLSNEKNAIEKELGETENDFRFLHSDVEELAFRIWPSYRDYLLLASPAPLEGGVL